VRFLKTCACTTNRLLQSCRIGKPSHTPRLLAEHSGEPGSFPIHLHREAAGTTLLKYCLAPRRIAEARQSGFASTCVWTSPAESFASQCSARYCRGGISPLSASWMIFVFKTSCLSLMIWSRRDRSTSSCALTILRSMSQDPGPTRA
jgi:hypothetical protein